jgi:predicted ATPase
MVRLIPELELLIGKQPPIPDLPPQDAQNRFQMVFLRFLSVFGRPRQPLVLFLDDLQWVDAATLDLIKHLVTEPDTRHLLLVGAYRQNEVDPRHPLSQMLAEIRESSAESRKSRSARFRSKMSTNLFWMLYIVSPEAPDPLVS